MAGRCQRLDRRSVGQERGRRGRNQRGRPRHIRDSKLAHCAPMTKGVYPVKWIKNLALAAIAAAALMAFIGAGTASATQLCTDSGGICTEYSGNISGTSTNATLATNLANVECSHSTTTINASSSTGVSIPGEVTALAFIGCQTEGIVHTPCTVTVRNLPYPASLTGKTLTVSDPAGAGAKVVCSGVISCEFLTTDATLTITNGEPTVAKAENVGLTHETGTLCPETASWNATYAVTSPTGLTVL